MSEERTTTTRTAKETSSYTIEVNLQEYQLFQQLRRSAKMGKRFALIEITERGPYWHEVGRRQ